MNIDEPVHPDEALLQRYFDGTLTESEADAFEVRLQEDAELAGRAGDYAAFFGALELHAMAADIPDVATSAVAAWAPASDASLGLPTTLSVFAFLNLLLGGALATLFAVRGPVDVFKAWVLGLKDIVVYAHQLSPSAEQAALLVPVGVIVVAALLGSTAYGLRRALIRTESRR